MLLGIQRCHARATSRYVQRSGLQSVVPGLAASLLSEVCWKYKSHAAPQIYRVRNSRGGVCQPDCGACHRLKTTSFRVWAFKLDFTAEVPGSLQLWYLGPTPENMVSLV